MEILAATPVAQLDEWHRDFMRDCIEPIILPKALALLQQHREAGDQLVIITATNRFVTAPIARRLGIRTLLATECERVDGRYTGRSTDIPCFREGKVTRLERWMLENGFDLEDSYFYSDSMNDLPLLERVTHAVAVDPDPNLRAEAERRGWPVVSLRD
ncbi:Phosphoserine phosphatase [compost metagenome]